MYCSIPCAVAKESSASNFGTIAKRLRCMDPTSPFTPFKDRSQGRYGPLLDNLWYGRCAYSGILLGSMVQLTSTKSVWALGQNYVSALPRRTQEDPAYERILIEQRSVFSLFCAGLAYCSAQKVISLSHPLSGCCVL
jgi:hypothetical protein